MWIIDFGYDMTEQEAAKYELPFQHVLEHVKPDRDRNKRQAYREKWWIHAEPRPAMRKALKGLTRYIVTPRLLNSGCLHGVPAQHYPITS